MSMRLLRGGLPRLVIPLAILLAILLVPPRGSAAHEIVGNRLFPATLGIDDLGVNDELSIPTVAVADTFTSGTVTTGTINPGFLWIGKGFQIGVEALIPINRRSGNAVARATPFAGN